PPTATPDPGTRRALPLITPALGLPVRPRARRREYLAREEPSPALDPRRRPPAVMEGDHEEVGLDEGARVKLDVGRCQDGRGDPISGEIVSDPPVKLADSGLVPPRRCRRHQELAIHNFVALSVVR